MAGNDSLAVLVEGVTKAFGGRRALDGVIRRNAWIYWFLLAITLVGLIALLFLAPSDTDLNWEKHPFFPMGVILALIWGMGTVSREFRKGNMLEFFLSRPVSRVEFFNTVSLLLPCW